MVTSYAYYTQVQGQLLITEKQFGPLLYLAQKATSIPRHQNHMESFEEARLIPEIVQAKLQQFIPSEIRIRKYLSTLYCICWQQEHGKMIMCESPTCQYA